jgi:hypothetical protein
VSENRVLRRISEMKTDEMVGSWKKLHYEELHNLYSLPSTIRTLKTGKMRWAWHVACMGRRDIGF